MFDEDSQNNPQHRAREAGSPGGLGMSLGLLTLRLHFEELETMRFVSWI